MISKYNKDSIIIELGIKNTKNKVFIGKISSRTSIFTFLYVEI
jgi:hypothetical protein